jgi:hypothetical protein
MELKEGDGAYIYVQSGDVTCAPLLSSMFNLGATVTRNRNDAVRVEFPVYLQDRRTRPDESFPRVHETSTADVPNG